MKKLIAAAIAVTMLMPLAKAQSCSDFINASNGKKLVYSNMDGKGNEQGKINYTSTKKGRVNSQLPHRDHRQEGSVNGSLRFRDQMHR